LKTSTKYLIALVAMLLGGGWWLFNNSANTSVVASQQNVDMAQAINECDAITEKAAANLVAIVEYQKLEIAGRKANVFKICMKDHGYIENPAWTKYATPIAEHNAKTSNTSVDEAFENLRRTHMVLVTSKQDEPLFWTPARPS